MSNENAQVAVFQNDPVTQELQEIFLRARLAAHLLERQAPEEAVIVIHKDLNVTWTDDFDGRFVTPLQLDIVAVAIATEMVNIASDVIMRDALKGMLTGAYEFGDEEGNLFQDKLGAAVAAEFGEAIVNAKALKEAQNVVDNPEHADKIAELKSKAPELYAFADSIQNPDGSFA
jgi:hypothetical protein